jgi:hypothetical protein
MKYITSEVTLRPDEYKLSPQEQKCVSLARANKIMSLSTHVIYVKINGTHYDTLYRISKEGIFTLILAGEMTKEIVNDWAYNTLIDYTQELSSDYGVSNTILSLNRKRCRTSR